MDPLQQNGFESWIGTDTGIIFQPFAPQTELENCLTLTLETLHILSLQWHHIKYLKLLTNQMFVQESIQGTNKESIHNTGLL